MSDKVDVTIKLKGIDSDIVSAILLGAQAGFKASPDAAAAFITKKHALEPKPEPVAAPVPEPAAEPAPEPEPEPEPAPAPAEPAAEPLPSTADVQHRFAEFTAAHPQDGPSILQDIMRRLGAPTPRLSELGPETYPAVLAEIEAVEASA